MNNIVIGRSQDHFTGQIDVSGYARGMYFVRIRQGGAVYNGKVILANENKQSS